jgi:IS5 family transposase
MTGPNPVDRGKTGSKIHVLSDRAGLPLSVAVYAANTNDADALKPLVRAIPAIRSRRGPRRRRPDKLHADKAYDHVELREWVRDRGIAVRIARKAIESSQKLGKHRWVIERSIAWLFGYRRLNIRYERSAHHFCAFLTLAATHSPATRNSRNHPRKTRSKPTRSRYRVLVRSPLLALWCHATRDSA